MKQADTTSTHAPMWFAFFAGPTAWTAHELLSYALVKTACGANLMLLEYLVSVATFALAAAGAYVAYRAQAGDVTTSPGTSREFMNLAALVLDVLFAFAIVMESLPETVVSPCL